MSKGHDPYRKTVNSWVMYDWANSAFFTTIVAGVFPTFYRSLAKGSGLDEANATAYWAYTTSIALLSVALIGPILGAISDQTGKKKKFIGTFTALGVVGTALMVLLGDDNYVYASLLFIVGSMGVAGANIFYESLLPHIATRGDIDQVSTRAYAIGYLGGGTLLIINALWIVFPNLFFLPNQGAAVRLSFLSVAIWWACFSIPLFRHVPEPDCTVGGRGVGNPLVAGFKRLAETFRQLRRYRQLMVFLVAFWLYNDGIGTIMKMAVAYGDELGIGTASLITALIVTQFVGIPCSFGFGWLAARVGAKTSILIGLSVYALISVSAFYLQNATQFFILAIMVGLVQGGTQALSRSLYGSMVPKKQSAEFFGLYSTSSKFAGTLGPVLFGVVGQWTGSSRASIASLIFFFIAGGLLLILVDVKEGVRVARNESG